MGQPTASLPPPGDAKDPGRLLRALFRLPLQLYERRFRGYDRLFNQEWILLTTTGRKTGKPHRVMLDLVGHDPSTRRYYVQPGWGRRCDWVRNIEVHPEVQAQVGSDSFPALALNVSGREGAEWLLRFSRRHPIRNWLIARFLLRIHVPLTRDETAMRTWLEKNFLVFALERIEAAK